MAITSCPYDLIDEPTMQAIRIAGFWKKGLPPVAGGTLDQTVSITQACRFIWDEQQQWRNNKGMIDLDGD